MKPYKKFWNEHKTSLNEVLLITSEKSIVKYLTKSMTLSNVRFFFIPHQLVTCQRHNNVLLCFSYATPVEWNKLVVEIRSVTNLETFKKKVNIAFTKVLHTMCKVVFLLICLHLPYDIFLRYFVG